ncbi:MAG: hypothetical protein LBQ05_02390 [Christensenellaceae bacterium]|jgi:hypothetical protein|nr:hypothetical protein [Christensenellaceae bacterium]
MLKNLTRGLGLAMVLTVITMSLVACGGGMGKYNYDRTDETIVFSAEATEEEITETLTSLGFDAEYEENKMTYTKSTPKTDDTEQWIELKKKGKGTTYLKNSSGTEDTAELTWEKDGDKITVKNGENAHEFTLDGKELFANEIVDLDDENLGDYVESYTRRIIFKK